MSQNFVKPEPSVLEMLAIAENCGLTTLDEALSNYYNHYSMFFYIPEYYTQNKVFVEEMFDAGLIYKTLESNKFGAKDLTIEEARKLYNEQD